MPSNTPVVTKSFGIFQSDIILRSALIKGLQNMRAKPWLLDYCFASLPQDQLTADLYGQKTVDAAKKWFLEGGDGGHPIEVKVFLNTRLDPASTPSISIALQSSGEDDATIGDVHYETEEDSTLQWPTLYGPFSVVSYNPKTGVVVMPPSAANASLGLGCVFIDDTGEIHSVLELIDGVTFRTAKDIRSPMSKAQLKGGAPSLSAQMESVVMAETYLIGIHVNGDDEKLIWLHSIVTFVLLAYKETLLEARGYERSRLTSAEMGFNSRLSDSGEPVYSRFISIIGYVRQQWPKAIKQKIVGTEFVPSASLLVGGPSVTLGDGGIVVNVTTAIRYGNAPPGTLDAAFVLALSNQIQVTSRQNSYNFNAGTADYCWIALPVGLTSGLSGNDFVDLETGTAIGFSLVGTVAIAGAMYAIWRSSRMGLGILSVQVF